jgi:hypothetical protein
MDQVLVVDIYQSTSEDGAIGELNLLVDGEALVQCLSQRIQEKVYQIYQCNVPPVLIICFYPQDLILDVVSLFNDNEDDAKLVQEYHNTDEIPVSDKDRNEIIN